MDGQLWENDRYVLKVEKLPGEQDDIRAVVFVKTEMEGLRFLEFVWKDRRYISNLIDRMKLEPSNKKLIIQ